MTQANTGTALDESFMALYRSCLLGETCETRAGTTRRMINVGATIPANGAYHRLKARRDSILHKFVETLWVIRGGADVQPMFPFMHRVFDFCDKEQPTVWRGAYGPRISVYLNDIASLLKREPDTRRAALAIYNNDLDFCVSSKDIPCNMSLVFVPESGNRLSLTVFIRSNDLVWGWSGINVFEWACVLSYVCGKLKLSPGNVSTMSVDLHLYERAWAMKLPETDEEYSTAFYGELPVNPSDFFVRYGEKPKAVSGLVDSMFTHCYGWLNEYVRTMGKKRKSGVAVDAYHAFTLHKKKIQSVVEREKLFEPLFWIYQGYCYFWQCLQGGGKGLRYFLTGHEQVDDSIKLCQLSADRLLKGEVKI